MTCLVVGGAGFIGRFVVSELLAMGMRTIVGDVVASDAPEFRTMDVRRERSIRKALVGVDCVIDLAWSAVPASATAHPIDDVRQNVLGTLRLFSSCVAAGVRRVVFCSSGGAIYGPPRALPISEDHPTAPISSYGVTKLAAESYLRMYGHMHGLAYIILRPGNAYGEGQRTRQQQGLVAACLNAAARKGVLDVWGDGSVVRDYVHAADIARAIAMAATADAAGQVLNIGTGRGHSVNEIIAIVRTVTGLNVNVRYQPARPFDAHDNVLDSRKAEQCLGWRAEVPLARGIERQWRALIDHPSGQP